MTRVDTLEHAVDLILQASLDVGPLGRVALITPNQTTAQAAWSDVVEAMKFTHYNQIRLQVLPAGGATIDVLNAANSRDRLRGRAYDRILILDPHQMIDAWTLELLQITEVGN